LPHSQYVTVNSDDSRGVGSRVPSSHIPYSGRTRISAPAIRKSAGFGQSNRFRQFGRVCQPA
jgi:hypothetical protein